MSSTELESRDKVAEPEAVDRAAIRRRRRWLYAFAGSAVVAICAFAAMQLLSNDPKKEAAKKAATPPVIVERFQLKAVGGQSGHGLAELVRRPAGDGLRVLAGGLRPVLDGEVYQLLLAGGQSEPKLLGNELVGQTKTFVGEAKVDAAELHKYKRIELRRVGRGNPPPNKLVLRGTIPG
jgi:hypothetical protein